MHIKLYNNQKGISLIELIIFIMILSVALTGITLVYINTTKNSADPLVRIRAIELAQTTLEEILLKSYDENTPTGGGCVKYSADTLCVAPTYASQPTASSDTALQSDALETNRSLFDDVDDYNNKLYCGLNVVAANTACPLLTCQNLEDQTGTDIANKYAGFSVCIKISFTGGVGSEIDFGSGTTVLTKDAKRIDVIVTDPINSQIGLSAYRLNF